MNKVFLTQIKALYIAAFFNFGFVALIAVKHIKLQKRGVGGVKESQIYKFTKSNFVNVGRNFSDPVWFICFQLYVKIG